MQDTTTLCTKPQALSPEHPRISVHPHSLTILSHSTLPLTKSYAKTTQGITKTPYPRAKTFNTRTVDASDIRALAAILQDLAPQPQSAVVRASLREGVKPRRVQRLLHGTGATLEHADRSWVCADSDGLTLPFDVDPASTQDLDHAARYLLKAHDLDRVSAVVVWSSSAFLTDTATIAPRKAKAHIWMMLDKPVCSESLEPWLLSKGFDGATARPVQVHYTANPVFAGGLIDPLAWRVKLFLGEADTYNTEGTGLYDTQEAERRAAIAKAEKEQRRRAACEARKHTAPQSLREHDTRHTQTALQRACERIATAREGELSDTFYRAANAVGRALGYDVGILAALVSAAVSRGTNPRKDEDTITRGYRDGASKHTGAHETAPSSGWRGAFENALPTETKGVKRLASGELVAALFDEGETVGLVWQRDGYTGVYGDRDEVKGAAFCVGDVSNASTVYLCASFNTALATLQHAQQSAVFGGRYTIKSALYAHNAQRQKQRDERREAKERGEEVPTQKPAQRAVVFDAANGWERAQAHEAALRYGLPLFVFEGDSLTQTPVDTALATARAVSWKQEQEQRMLQGFDVVRLNTPKLPTIEKQQGTLCILSGKGTEKTTRAAEWVHTNDRASVLYIAPRIELVEDAARKYGLTSYNALKEADNHREEGSAFFDTPRIAICLPSLLRLLDKKRDALALFDVVILDEVSQTLRSFQTLVEASQRPLVWDVWKELLSSARLVLAMDAGLDAPTLAMLRELRGRAGFEVWHNTHRSGGVIRLHPDKEAVLQHAQNALAMGQSVFFAENVLGKVTKGNGAHETAEALRETGKSGVVVSSQTTKERDVRRFLENPATARPSWLVATPTINTGFSIPHGVFDTVCASFSSCVGLPSDGAQFVCRVRGATVLNVALDFRKKNKHAPTTEQRAIAYAAQSAFLRFIDGRTVHTDTLYSDTFDNLRTLDAAACREWAWAWLVLMACDGWAVEIVKPSPHRQDKTKERREKVKAERIEAVTTARELTDHAAKQLQRRRLTQADADALKKKQIRDAYNTQQDDVRELVVCDQDGKLRRQIERLELAADTTDTQARAREARAMGRGDVLRGDLRAVGLERELYRRALWTAGVDPYSLSIDAAYTYTAKSERVSAFVSWLEAWRVPLAGVVALPPTNRLRSNPLHFLGALLKRVGITTKAQGDNAARRYSVDGERLAWLRGWIEQRGRVRLCDDGYVPCKTLYDKGVSAKREESALVCKTLYDQGVSAKREESALVCKTLYDQGVSAHNQTHNEQHRENKGEAPQPDTQPDTLFSLIINEQGVSALPPMTDPNLGYGDAVGIRNAYLSGGRTKAALEYAHSKGLTWFTEAHIAPAIEQANRGFAAI